MSTLLEAFAQLTSRQQEFEMVLLIRGGGNELDLVAYDDYDVAKAIALCGLPVVTGLGHTADQSLCDIVSYKALETPTAATRFLVDQVQALYDHLRLMRDRLYACALELSLVVDGTCCHSARNSSTRRSHWYMTAQQSPPSMESAFRDIP